MPVAIRNFLVAAVLAHGSLTPLEAVGSYRKPVDLKLLVLATDGKEAGLAAMAEFLEYAGTQFDVVKLAEGEPLPPLGNNTKGFYQGVILTTGNLGVCKPDCRSALSTDDWARLDAYTRDYGVRTLSYYTFPEPRYGLTYVGSVATSDGAPLTAEFTADAAPVFRDLRTESPFRVAGAFVHLAKPAAATGERTVPLIRSGADVVAVLHEKPDGREYLALTMDNNPELYHSLLLHRSLLDWLTRGIHLGWRKTWLMPQVDDLFLASFLFETAVPYCATAVGPALPSAEAEPCRRLRIGGDDLEAIANWQNFWRGKPQFADFRVSMAYNGLGVQSQDDPLLVYARAHRDDFYWVNHTFTHRDLDCYAPTEVDCRGANVEEGRFEVARNREFALGLGFSVDAPSMVTPQITGLSNPEFLKGAADEGIRYFVSDTSRQEFRPPKPNTLLQSSLEPRVLFIPRRPTAVFYNASDAGLSKPGSEPDEYNFLFGPNGLFRRGDGLPFHNTDQSYESIVAQDRDLTVKYMLRGEMYPLMFHQANLWQYPGSRSLMTDLLQSTMEEFEAISRLPVVSVSQTRLGQMLEERLGYWQAGVTATLTPGSHVTVTSRVAAVVPLTGVCDVKCEAYGPYTVASVAMAAGQTREFRIAPLP